MTLHHLGRLQLEDFHKRFSARDLAILQTLFEHRFLTGQHIVRLHFHDHATFAAGARACSRVMERLQRLHTITRIQRRVGGIGGGSSSQVWTLDFNGHRIITRDTHSPRRYLDPSTTFLTHTLAVAETRTRLTEIVRTHERTLSNIEIERTAWRQFLNSTGQPTWLKPDLATVLSDHEFEDRWFIEVDLATESPKTVIAKCGVYETYRRSGTEQTLHEVFPRVLWLTTTQRRADQLTKAISSTRSLHPRLFTVAVFDDLEAVITDQQPIPREKKHV